LPQKIFEHEIGRWAVKIVDGFAIAQILQDEVGGSLDADAPLHDAFAGNNALHVLVGIDLRRSGGDGRLWRWLDNIL
jgi:hypothetical protein